MKTILPIAVLIFVIYIALLALHVEAIPLPARPQTQSQIRNVNAPVAGPTSVAQVPSYAV